MIYIGSTAIKSLFPDFKREPKDADMLVNDMREANPLLFGRSEFHVIPPLMRHVGGRELTADEVYTLKASHLFWDIKWDKHIYDIQFLQDKGCRIIVPLFYELYDFWKEKHGEPRRSKLNVSSQEFFKNGLKGGYDHDYLHALIKDTPTYTKILKDGEEVDVSEEKFNGLSFDEKCDLVREELYVMAYERLAGRHWRSAYAWMLKQFIMYHAPMWESVFIIENYNVLKRPLINFKLELDRKLQKV